MQRVNAMTTHTIASSSVQDLIGRTPLLRLDRLVPANQRVEIYAKAEFQNPGGSVKDRAAAAILDDGERSGRLHRGACHPRRDIREHRHRLRDDRRGARLQAEAVRARQRHGRTETHAACLRRRADPDQPHGGLRRRHSRGAPAHQEIPERYFYADQYNNDANWRAHYDTTAAEILDQTDGRLTHFVAGLGTSGTFMGVGRRLREHDAGHPADLGPARFAAARRRGAQAHGDSDPPGHLRSAAGRRGREGIDRARRTI